VARIFIETPVLL